MTAPRTKTLSGALAENARLLRCINMAMGCLTPLSANREERLAWYRLFDAREGREPRDKLTDEERR